MDLVIHEHFGEQRPALTGQVGFGSQAGFFKCLGHTGCIDVIVYA